MPCLYWGVSKIHSVMYLCDTQVSHLDAKSSFEKAITKQVAFCAIDQWRCHTEAYILMMSFTRLFSDYNMLDDYGTIPSFIHCQTMRATLLCDSDLTVIRAPLLLNCQILSDTIGVGDAIEYSLNSHLGNNNDNG